VGGCAEEGTGGHCAGKLETGDPRRQGKPGDEFKPPHAKHVERSKGTKLNHVPALALYNPFDLLEHIESGDTEAESWEVPESAMGPRLRKPSVSKFQCAAYGAGLRKFKRVRKQKAARCIHPTCHSNVENENVPSAEVDVATSGVLAAMSENVPSAEVDVAAS